MQNFYKISAIVFLAVILSVFFVLPKSNLNIAFATGTLTQKSFRIYNDAGAWGSATPYAAENANYNVAVSTNFRIRFETANTGASGGTAAVRTLQFQENSGTWTTITTNSNNVRLCSSETNTDGTSSNGPNLTANGTYDTNGQGKWSSASTTSETIAHATYLEDEYCLSFQSGAVGSSYNFRITNNGTALAGGYTNTPTIAPISGVAAPTFSSAATNTAGTVVTVAFSKAMADPTGKQAQFTVLVNGSGNTVTAAALNADTTKIDLTLTSVVHVGDTVTVAYTAGTVTSSDTGILASFTVQTVTNNSTIVVPAPTFSSAATNTAGTIVTVAFSKAMADPTGKQAQFTVMVNGSGDTVTAAALNADTTKIDLTLTSVIHIGDTVTVAYTAGNVTSSDTGVLASFTAQTVTNNSTVVVPPTVVSAATSSDGTKVLITFSKAMNSVAAYYAEFSVNNGSADSVTIATLHPGNSSIIDLTVTNAIVVGQTVTVAYSGSDVTSTDTGILLSFSGQHVTNSSTIGPILSNLTVNQGILIPLFSSNLTSYTDSVANSVSSLTVTPTVSNQPGVTITVDGTPVTSGSPSGSISLSVGLNTITIVVTAPDLLTTDTYTIGVTRAPSSDATLSNLSISQGTLSPTFSSSTISYTDSVANSVSALTVTPTVNQSNATVTVNGTPVTSGSPSGSISLSVGSNTITTTVTAQDSSIKTYTITVTRAAALSSAKAITAFSFNGLSPAVTATISGTSITATVPYGTSATNLVATFTTTGSSVAVGATTQVSGTTPNNFTSPVTYTVTAADSSTQNYTVTVSVASASSDATLSNLSISQGTLSPTFSSSTISYTDSVANSVSSLTVTPTVSNQPGVTITVDGTPVTSGSPSGSISLSVGSNTITTTVTAQDSSTTKTYTITVTRAAASVPTPSPSPTPTSGNGGSVFLSFLQNANHPTSANQQTNQIAQTDIFTQNLKYGSRGNQVVLLQDIFKKLGFFPQSINSNGNFGPATLKAVQVFQIKYNIAKPGISGYGQVGPKTRAALNLQSK